MEKEVETASEIVNSESSGGLHSFKETVYNILGDFFGWLSTHQSLAIVIILIVLGIMVWLILRAKKYRKQFENEVYIKKKEMEKKEALIEEQEKKLTNLQKKLSDQQGAVSEALLETIRNITGYDADQLPIFFKSLAQISGNPLEMADSRATTTPDSPRLEGESNDFSGTNDSKERLVSDEDSLEKSDASEAIASGDDSSEEGDAKNDKFDAVAIGLNMILDELIEANKDLQKKSDELQEKLEIIEKQSKAIIGLPTPVIQVWDDILILPLIGTIDTERASQIIENLLNKI